jgi:predicted lipid-binding transport protein (Tim44 family)
MPATTSATGGSEVGNPPTSTRTAETEAPARTQRKPATPKQASRQAAAPSTKQRARPPVAAVSGANGGRLLLGGLALGALALASGSLLLFTSRAGVLEPRS